MTCGEFRQNSDAYVEGVAPNGATLSVEAHAAECPECERDLLERLDLGASAEAALRALAPPVGDAVLARIESLLPPQPRTQPDACYLMAPDLSALLDGALSPEDAESARSHLDECVACARDYRAYMAVDSALLRNRAEPSLRLARRMKALAAKYGVAAPSRGRSMRARFAPWIAPAGALAAAGLCLFMLGVHVGAGGKPEAPAAQSMVFVEASEADAVAAGPTYGIPGSGYPAIPGTFAAVAPSEPVAEARREGVAPRTSSAPRYAAGRGVSVRSYASAPRPSAPTGPAAGGQASEPSTVDSGPEPVRPSESLATERRSRLGLEMRAFDHLVAVSAVGGPSSEASPSVVVSQPTYEIVEAETIRLASGSTGAEPFEPLGPSRLY